VTRFNGAGNTIVVAATSDSTFSRLYFGNGDGTFQAGVNLTVGKKSSFVVAAPFPCQSGS
jgi:hypothetical protein